MRNKMLIMFTGLVILGVSFSHISYLRKEKLSVLESNVVASSEKLQQNNLKFESAIKSLNDTSKCDNLVGFQLNLYKLAVEHNKRTDLKSYSDFTSVDFIKPTMMENFDDCDRSISTSHFEFVQFYLKLASFESSVVELDQNISKYESFCSSLIGRNISHCFNQRLLNGLELKSGT